jgi:hypothetical protein
MLPTATLSTPAVAPEETVTEAVSEVPPALTVGLNVTLLATAPVDRIASTVLPEPKPVPVIVIVTGVVPVDPTTIGVVGLRVTEVIVGATLDGSPCPRAFASEITAPLPVGAAGFVTVTVKDATLAVPVYDVVIDEGLTTTVFANVPAFMVALVTVAPGSKPAPEIVSDVVAVVPGTCDGLTLTMPDAVTVKTPTSDTAP